MSGGTVNETWRFEIGQMITHRDQPMLSEVVSRRRAGRLSEVYGVRAVDPNRSNPDRMILGEVLVAP